MENQSNNGTQNNPLGFNSSFNHGEKTENIKLIDIVERIESCDKKTFDISNEIFMNLRLSFEGFESKQIETNYFELFEFVYSLTKEVLNSPHLRNPQ